MKRRFAHPNTICPLLLILAGLHTGMPLAQNADPPPADWMKQATAEIGAREYHFSWKADRHLSAPNRAHDLRTLVDERGFSVESRTAGSAKFKITIRLDRFGRVNEMSPVERGVLDPIDERVTLRRPRLTEWFVNEPRGLEHGFDIEAPPAGRGEVVLRLALESPLMAYPLGDQRRAVVFRNAAGTDLLHYGGLVVIDATGTELPARIEIDPDGLRILFDDSEAIYPVTVDPVVSDPVWSVTGPLFWGLGSAVATAGDVNGDGYSDVIVGTPRYDGGFTDEGLVSVYHGGPNGLSTGAVWSFISGRQLARFGEVVSTAGDVNGDGYHDVVVGAPKYFNGHLEEGRAYVFYGSASGIAGSPWITESNEVQAEYGSSVDCAGDVNNDGYHDVVIGAPLSDESSVDGGKIYLYYGSSTGLSTTPGWSGGSAHTGAHFAASVAGAGDINGDGYGDLVAGAPMYDWPDVDEGRVFFYLGSATVPSYGGGFVRSGSADEGIHFGAAVAGAGDLNGDGYADAIAGAPDGGGVTIFYGSSSGINGLGPGVGSASSSTRHGAAVATAGDVNGDGLADIVVGAPGAERAEVYCGKRGGNPTACGSLSFSQNGSMFGATVDTAGDVDGDGYSDVIVGAPDYTINSFLYGRVFVYRGSPDGLTANREVRLGNSLGRLGESLASADVNGDGFSDVIVGEPEFDGGTQNEGRAFIYYGSRDGLGTTADEVAGNLEGGRFGAAVANAGDVNGDGYDDVVIGAPNWTVSMTDQGRVYFYPGGASGLSSVALSQIGGTQAGGFFGAALASAGDVNGDGYSDVAIGAFGHDGGQIDEGRVFIHPGSSTGLSFGSWPLEADVTGAEFGRSIAAGDMNGDGFSDVVVGAPRDSSTVHEGGRVYVHLGSLNGPISPAASIGAGDTTVEHLGWSVASGDIDGDGFADVVAGSPDYTNGQSGEGRFSLFRGAADGTLSTIAERESGISNARLGFSVAVAGDTNGDGFPEVIAGAPGNNVFGSGAGFVRVWYGAPSGIAQSHSWETTAITFGSQGLFGSSVSGAGDVNGDGFAEVIVGAPNASPQVNDAQGGTALFLGGGGHGMDRIPRMQQPFSTSDGPIALLGRSGDDDSVRLRSRARTAAGRDLARVEYEVKPLGVPLDGSGTRFSSKLKTSAPGSDGSRTNYSTRITGLGNGPHYHWRLRFLSPNPRFPHTRWLWPASVAPSAKSFMTSCNLVLWHRDLDGDGFGTPDDTVAQCDQPAGYVAAGGDCDESDPSINPGASELVCDGIDNDCSPQTADARDDDGDGFDVCMPGDAGDADGLTADCNDDEAATYPGAPETNNGYDDQCPGDEGFGLVDEMDTGVGFTDPGDPTLMCWDVQPGATDYEVLRSSDPAFSAGCVSTVVSGATCVSGLAPADGETYYYLVRTIAPFAGSWGTDSDGVERVIVCPE